MILSIICVNGFLDKLVAGCLPFPETYNFVPAIITVFPKILLALIANGPTNGGWISTLT